MNISNFFIFYCYILVDPLSYDSYDLFFKAYSHVSGVINDIYKELTKSAKTDGGTAYLTLENSEVCLLPILYVICIYWAINVDNNAMDMDYCMH